MNVLENIFTTKAYRNLIVLKELKAELEKTADSIEFKFQSNNDILKLRDNLISTLKNITKEINYVFELDINDLATTTINHVHTTMPILDTSMIGETGVYTRSNVTTLENRVRENSGVNHGYFELNSGRHVSLGNSNTAWRTEESISSRFNASNDAVTLQADTATLNGDGASAIVLDNSNGVVTSARISAGTVNINDLAQNITDNLN